MAKTSSQNILQHALPLFAQGGSQSFSIRKLAKQIPITPSVIYHYFPNEDELLKEMFNQTNSELGRLRSNLPKVQTAKEMLLQRIEFQFDHQEKIIAVLKYYLSFRDSFTKFRNGYIPDKSALHMEEVLRLGIETKEFTVHNIEDDAKVMTHAVNGFLLEYYPHKPKGKERRDVVNRINSFLLRSLTSHEKI